MSSKNDERPKNAKDDATSPAPESEPNVIEKGKNRGEKRYELDTLKRNVTKEEKETFNKMKEEDQKKYVINAWIQENRTLDKKDMHEVSLEEEKLIGLQT